MNNLATDVCIDRKTEIRTWEQSMFVKSFMKVKELHFNS